MHGALSLGPMSDEYACLVEDVLRIAALHVVIHLMFVLERDGERLMDRRAVVTLLYALLGVAVYHLVFKRMLVIRRSDESAPSHK